jgi:hypothetical protein
MPEKISSKLGPPPLYAQPMLFWLANIISSKALKGNPTLEKILSLTPPKGRKHWVLQWEESMLDKPVFPVWTACRPKEKSRSPSSWGHQASNWAIRAGFVDGMGLHCPRREILVKTNGMFQFDLTSDSGYTSRVRYSLMRFVCKSSQASLIYLERVGILTYTWLITRLLPPHNQEPWQLPPHEESYRKEYQFLRPHKPMAMKGHDTRMAYLAKYSSPSPPA